VQNFGPDYYDYDNPISSCILDTYGSPMWIKNNYHDWNLLSSPNGSVFFSPKSSVITEPNINEIKNHL
jgi:hypothetical protein